MMNLVRRILLYLNPIEHLGDRNYSTHLPFIITCITYILSEIFAYHIIGDPMIVGLYVIYVPIIYVIYFSFRFGMRGGIIVSILTAFYYFYIIYTRNYRGNELKSGIEVTLVLVILFLLTGVIIGWLKQKIDLLIENEANEKRRLQAIFQQLPVGIIVTDAKGKVTQLNKKTSYILGKKIPLGVQVGKDTFVEYKKDGRFISSYQTPLYQTLHNHKRIVDAEYTIRRPDGKERYVQINTSLINNRSGKIIAAASIINDITAQKELEDRKDDFVNMASHELKTPLTSLGLFINGLSLALKENRDKKINKAIYGIEQQVLRLQDLVSSLLDVSRAQTGKLALNKEDFRLDQLILESVEALQQTSNSKKIIYNNKKTVEIRADRFRIHQVLTNLIANALKYSYDDKEIKISIKQDKEKVVVAVADSGIGIAKNQQRKIFERLYQVTNPDTKTYPGLGMGLYISKEIILRHRGKLWVESTLGKGSTFFFSLPRQKAAKRDTI